MATTYIKKRIITRLIVLLGFCIVLVISSGFFAVSSDRIISLAVGQGDGVLIQSDEGASIVIDCGPSDEVVYALGPYIPFASRMVDILIITHSDSDHVTGCLSILETIPVGKIILLDKVDDLPAYQAMIAYAEAKGIELITPFAGDEIQLPGLDIEVLWPRAYDWEQYSSNDRSYVVRVVSEDVSMLLTGDASEEVEKKLVALYGDNLRSDILKLGHHGSKTSTSAIFLQTVDPQYAIVSAGIDNRYGHPHAEVIRRVESQGIEWCDTRAGNCAFDLKKIN